MLTDMDWVDRFCGELRRGAPAALIDLQGRRRRATLVTPLEMLTQSRLDAIAALAEAPLNAAVTARRAEALKLRCYDGDIARLRVDASLDAALLRDLADPARDLARPMKGPFEAVRDSDSAPARRALALCLRAGLLPAALIAEIAYEKVRVFGLCELSLDMAAAHAGQQPPTLHRLATATLPLAFDSKAQLHGFRPSDGGRDHYALVIGAPTTQEPVLTRLHSECFTGDLLGSMKCDCGPQLRAAIARIAAEGGGVLLYLAQEGRGIGMANKLRAYALQDQGFDTVEANHRLGFEDDLRDFAVAAAMLKALGYTQIRLMTNNPRKAAAMTRAGVTVAARTAHALAPNIHNQRYLQVKAERSGHLL